MIKEREKKKKVKQLLHAPIFSGNSLRTLGFGSVEVKKHNNLLKYMYALYITILYKVKWLKNSL